MVKSLCITILESLKDNIFIWLNERSVYLELFVTKDQINIHNNKVLKLII